MDESVPVLTVDGPSGSGKGTVGRRVAARLGWHFLDTGALYRVLAIAALAISLSLDQGAALADLALGLDVRFEGGAAGEEPRVLLEGRDVSRETRTEESGAAASRVAAHPEVRAALFEEISERALAYAIRQVGVRQIVRFGILAASLKAMALAVQALAPAPHIVLIDGRDPLPLDYPQQPVIDCDDRCPSIAAASILAKVHRDRCMEAYHRQFPQYNFASHKGYATREHLEALQSWGPCVLHRRTFRGVKEWMEVRR